MTISLLFIMTRILIIEDNLLNMELATDLLEANEFTVYPATTANEGIRLAQQILPDLILMDFGLPDMHGLDATRLLKTNKATARVPIIALTAHAMKGDEKIALSTGCNGYLTKPINTRTFVATILQFLDKDILQKNPK